jgi:hypothetical protein
MRATNIDLVVNIYNLTLAVFFSNEVEAWQFRVLSPGGEVFGCNKIYFSPEAAEQAGRQFISAGD